MKHLNSTNTVPSFSALAIALTAMVLSLTGATAHAACGSQAGPRLGQAVKMPFLAALATPAAAAVTTGRNSDEASIVGLWHVIYTSQGSLFLETFDHWHSDGTEFEGANFNPTEGNICFGVWKKTGQGTIKLFHIGWNFDPSGNPIGTFTLQETNTVAVGGATYTGTFDFKIYDVNGALTYEASGTQQATRITVN